MPKSTLTQSHIHPRMPFQIAQGETKQAVSEGQVVTEKAAEGGEKEHSVGEIPDANLLFMNSCLVFIAMVAFAFVVGRRLAAIPKGAQNFAEWLVECLNAFTIGIIGPAGEKYTPLVGTVFIYIFLSNMLGQIPGFHSPTANISLTLALGVIIFIYVQLQGIKNNGFGNYIKHFMGPMPAMAPLMLPVELISEIVKPFTLAVRLFGNIFGEDVIILVLAGLTTTMGAKYLSFLPVHFPVLLLAMLTAFVQAMVFSILTCIYLSLMAPHDHGHGDDHLMDTAHSHAAGHH